MLARLASRTTPRPASRLTTVWIPLLRESWPIGINTIFSSLVQQAPLIALSAVSAASVGLYAAAAKLPLQLVLIPLIIRGSTVPLLSKSWTADPIRFLHQVRLMTALSSLGGLGLSIVGIGLAPVVTEVMFGPAFRGVAPAFAWLMVMASVLLPGILLGEVLIVTGNQRVNLAIQAGSLPLLTLLLIWLLPPYGAAGAAAALALTQAAVGVATVVAVRLIVGPSFSMGWLSSAGLGGLIGFAMLLVAGPAIGATLATGAAVSAGMAVGGYMERAPVAWLARRLAATWRGQLSPLARGS
jgi:O-antigen/teichoic acid export membrane protein